MSNTPAVFTQLKNIYDVPASTSVSIVFTEYKNALGGTAPNMKLKIKIDKSIVI